jgi:predicted amidohydrolase YtcJ
MLLIRYAKIYPSRTTADIRIRGGKIHEIAPRLKPTARERVIDAAGGALLPGLHDHHMHLFSLAAARASVDLGARHIDSPADVAGALRCAPGSGWIRAVNYHESTAGDLTMAALDALTPARPVRIQHRSGKLWIVNRQGARLLGLESAADAGIERDDDGAVTGRLFRMDSWLRARLSALPAGSTDVASELAAVSADLARFGVTGLTDASFTNDDAAVQSFIGHIDSGAIQQRVRLMGTLTMSPFAHPRAHQGEVKMMLDDDNLPDLASLVQTIGSAAAMGRGVAFHCVSATELLFALAALGDAAANGDVPPSRIEHASLCPRDALSLLQAAGATVVTQPILIHDRGDQYIADHAARELPSLYRARSYLRHEIPVACSSDAPYGDMNPWSCIRAATTRTTAAGEIIGRNEALTPEQAIAGYLTSPDAPGGPPRQISTGAPADLCLLAEPWHQARDTLSGRVALTIVDGRIVCENMRA